MLLLNMCHTNQRWLVIDIASGKLESEALTYHPTTNPLPLRLNTPLETMGLDREFPHNWDHLWVFNIRVMG
jgi:hypothetical protein